jgi:hypothetical protein
MTMQLLVRCSACDKPSPSEGKIKPDVQRETGLVVVSPPQGWFVVVDTTPTRAGPATKDAVTVARGGKPAGGPGAPRSKLNVRMVCSAQCAGTLVGGLGDGLAEAFADYEPRPGARGSLAYRAPMLTLRVMGPYPGNVPVRLDRNLLHETQALDRDDSKPGSGAEPDPSTSH